MLGVCAPVPIEPKPALLSDFLDQAAAAVAHHEHGALWDGLGVDYPHRNVGHRDAVDHSGRAEKLPAVMVVALLAWQCAHAAPVLAGNGVGVGELCCPAAAIPVH